MRGIAERWRMGGGAAGLLAAALLALVPGAGIGEESGGESGGEVERSEASDEPAAGVVRAPLPADQSEGMPVARVFYDLRGRSGVTGGDGEARRQVEKAAGVRVGDGFSVAAVELAVGRVRALGFVREAGWALYESERAGHVVVVLTVGFGDGGEVKGGGLLTGEAGDFPVLYRDERTLLRLQLDGGFGFYQDVNPWFGDGAGFTARSPVAGEAATGSGATWGEMSAEYGLAGIRRVGRTPFWVYGAGTALTSASVGQDLFRDDARGMTRVEDLYAGVVAGTPGGDWGATVSAGRQNWQLHDGFLFSRFAAGANAGPHPALYLNPRTAYEMTVLAKMRWRDVSLEGFYLDPAEIDFLDSGTKYGGLSLAYARSGGVEASLLWYRVPESMTMLRTADGGVVPREGMRTVDVRLGDSSLFGVKGLELFGEHAWQGHGEADWEARAWYVRGGYTFGGWRWRPNLSYRYASFSGDDPGTSRYEGFDAPMSSGLDTWVQGVNAKKTVTNSNLNSHRVRLNLVATPKVTLTFDWWVLRADEGGGPRDYGQEVDLGVRWAVSRRWYFLGVAGVGFPGERLEERAGRELRPWTTVEASMFWNF